VSLSYRAAPAVSTSGSTGQTTWAVSRQAGTVAGDWILIYVFGGTASMACTGFAAKPDANGFGGLLSRYADGTEGASFSITGLAGNRVTALIVTLAGGASVLDPAVIATPVSGGPASSVSVPSITLANNGDWLLWFCANQNGFSGAGYGITPPSGFTSQGTNGAQVSNATVMLADDQVTASGATGAQAGTFGGSSFYSAVMIGITPAVPGGSAAAAVATATAAALAPGVPAGPAGVAPAGLASAAAVAPAPGAAAVTPAVRTFPGLPPNPLGARIELNLGGAWTDITAYVMLRDTIKITGMGRTDESGTITASQLTMTLRNDGRFTPKNSGASGVYYPNITRNCQVRVSVSTTSVTGVPYSGYRFFGEISSWPPGYDISGRDTHVQVTASGIWRRIAQASVSIGSAYWRYVQLLSGAATPAAYWAMEDGNASAAFILSDGTGTNLAFSAGTPSFAADTASFPGSNALPQFNLARMAANVSSAATPSNNIIRFALSVPVKGDSTGAAIATGAQVCSVLANGTIKRVDVVLIANQLRIDGYTSAAGGTPAFSGTVASKINGVPVLASVEITPSGSGINWALRLVKPGATAILGQVTGTRGSSSVAAVTQVQLNGQGRLTDTACGQLSVWYTVQPILAGATAIGGNAGETATARFQRICAESNIATTVIGSGAAAMGPQLDGKLSDILQGIEDTDGGMLFESRDGFGLGYRTLASMKDQAADVTFSHGSGVLGAPLAPVYDDQLIRNAVTVTGYDGYSVIAQLTSGPMSTAAPPNGVGGGYTAARSINASTHAQVNAIAQQLLWRGTTDEVRYPTVTVNFQRTAAAAFLGLIPGLQLGDHLQITSMPAFLGGGTAKQLIWGYSEVLGGNPEAWTITFNTIPEAPFESGFSPGVFGVTQAPGGSVAAGSPVGSTVEAAQLPPAVPPVPTPVRHAGATTSYATVPTPYDWLFTVTGTPADTTYFGCTPDQAWPIAPGDTFTHSAGLGGPFTVTTVELPPGANATVHFTPDATAVMSSGVVSGGKDGDLWINIAADNQLEQWQDGAWTPYKFGTGALAGTLTGLNVVGAYFLSGAGGGSAWQSAVPSVPGYYLYWDTGTGTPQVIAAISAAAGSDQWGNTWQGGVTMTGLISLLNVLSVEDTAGNILTSIDYLGNISAPTLSAQDVLLGGTSVYDWLNELPSGIVNRGWTPSGPWPSTPIGTTNTAIVELDQVLMAGRSYRFSVVPTTFITTVAAQQYVMQLRATTDGSTPTNTSPVLRQSVQECPTAGQNVMTPSCEYIPGNLTVDTLYRLLVTANVQGAGNTFQYQGSLEIRIEDIGPWLNETNSNNGAWFGAGSSGGSGSLKNYVKTYYATSTHSYFGLTGTYGSGANGKRSDNGSLYQGCPSGHAFLEGDQYGFAGFDYATIAADLAGATITKVTLRLTNATTWYSSGMQAIVGYSTTTTYNDPFVPGAGTHFNQVNYHINRGQTLTKDITSSSIGAAFQSGGATSIVIGRSADRTTGTDLNNYGSFIGYLAANTAANPRLQISYTK